MEHPMKIGPIEDEIPLPERQTRRKYPFDKLAVGQSFRVEGVHRSTIQNAVYQHCRRHSVELSVRVDGDGVRVWRIA